MTNTGNVTLSNVEVTDDVVTNTGNDNLVDIEVTDDQGVVVTPW